MLKKLFASLVLIGVMAAPAAARGGRTQVDTQEFAVERCTSTTVSISATAGAPTDILYAANNVYLSSATFIELYNVDTAATVNCGYDTGVSTATAQAAYGREVLPKIGLGLKINADNFPGIWCLTQATATTRATVTKCR